MDAEKEVQAFLDLPENKSYKEIAANTKKFILGYYSPSCLERSSVIDFIETEKKQIEYTLMEPKNWNDRKKLQSEFRQQGRILTVNRLNLWHKDEDKL
ncbi:MAG: hypothetical protein B6D68_04080 [spirochete symbiont of Stewartia floridana]|nr:MAG: hypothetical protein B6D68_04080 [spirochete symbiont of Stewartia floridana]